MSGFLSDVVKNDLSGQVPPWPGFLVGEDRLGAQWRVLVKNGLCSLAYLEYFG